MSAKLLTALTLTALTLTGCFPTEATGNDPPKPKDEPETFTRMRKPSPDEEKSADVKKPVLAKPVTLAGEIGTVIRSELAPLVAQVGDLKRKTAQLDEMVSQLEARRESFESDTLRGLAGVRSDLDGMRGVVQALASVVDELKARPGEANADTARLSAAVEKLMRKVDDLNKDVKGFVKPNERPAPGRILVPIPVPIPAAKRMVVTLGCGYRFGEMTVTPGMVIECPTCKKWFKLPN